jgi:hypothetical protein
MAMASAARAAEKRSAFMVMFPGFLILCRKANRPRAKRNRKTTNCKEQVSSLRLQTEEGGPFQVRPPRPLRTLLSPEAGLAGSHLPHRPPEKILLSNPAPQGRGAFSVSSARPGRNNLALPRKTEFRT